MSTPRLSDPSIGEGVLDPNEPAPAFVIDGFIWIWTPGTIEFTDPDSPMDWSFPDDDCPF